MKETDHTSVIGELHEIEQRIREDEGKSIKARWKFGTVLLKLRGDNGRLPHGLLAAVIEKDRISRSEIHRRMQLAEKFKSESQVSHVWDRYGSWRRLASEELPRTPRKEKPEPSPEKAEPSPEDRARTTVRGLVLWAGDSDDRCDKLVAILREDLRPLGINVTKAGS